MRGPNVICCSSRSNALGPSNSRRARPPRGRLRTRATATTTPSNMTAVTGSAPRCRRQVDERRDRNLAILRFACRSSFTMYAIWSPALMLRWEIVSKVDLRLALAAIDVRDAGGLPRRLQHTGRIPAGEYRPLARIGICMRAIRRRHADRESDVRRCTGARRCGRGCPR